MYSIRAICQSNQLNESHHYVISNERSTAGHNLCRKRILAVSHVVYDSSVFLILQYFTIPKSGGKALLGIYNPKSRVLVTLKETMYK